MSPDQEYVLKTIEARDVHFVRFWFTDLLGRVKSFAVSPNELASAFDEGMVFDGGSIAGFAGAGAGERDMLAFPDASTFQVLPWRPDSNAVARMFCNICLPDGTPLASSPRHLLGLQEQKLAQAGYDCSIAPKVEFFYFEDSSGTELLDSGGYFDLNTLDSASDLRRDTVLTLEKMGIPVEFSHHESAPSQHEVDLRPADASAMADAVQTYKMVVKEVAYAHGVYASFMPKPRADCPGSGMHVRIGLYDSNGANVFYDAGDAEGFGLSQAAKHFVAGVLAHAAELSLLTNQYVNSYKRLLGGVDAPSCASWGRSNRQVLVRVPDMRSGKAADCCIEVRNPDPACNPYLAFAGMLAAGYDGISSKLELGPASQEGACQGKPLPENLGQAVSLFEASAFARELLGEEAHAFLVAEKRREWADFQRSITDWELRRYLEVL